MIKIPFLCVCENSSSVNRVLQTLKQNVRVSFERDIFYLSLLGGGGIFLVVVVLVGLFVCLFSVTTFMSSSLSHTKHRTQIFGGVNFFQALPFGNCTSSN